MVARRRTWESGFSVIELIVVVAVILIIAAIAVPRMLHARMKANEAAAMASVRTVETAQSVYANMFPQTGYSNSLLNLGSNGSNCETITRTNACLIDSTLASGLKGSYLFDVTGDGMVPVQSYTVTATPQTSSAGECMFSGDQSGAISSSVAGSGGSFRSASSVPGGSSGGC